MKNNTEITLTLLTKFFPSAEQMNVACCICGRRNVWLRYLAKSDPTARREVKPKPTLLIFISWPLSDVSEKEIRSRLSELDLYLTVSLSYEMGWDEIS